MALQDDDVRHLNAAEGFLSLGMLEDAFAELENIDPFCRSLPEVLAVRLGIYQAASKWEEAVVVAKQLARDEPANVQWPISLAYATRRAESIEAARAILLQAAEHHGEEPVIHYNLACYDCQLGALASAKEHLKRAFKLQPECRLMALDDQDLRPLWDELRGAGEGPTSGNSSP